MKKPTIKVRFHFSSGPWPRFYNSDFVCDKKHVLAKIWFFKNGCSALHKNPTVFPKKLCRPSPFMWSAGTTIVHTNLTHTTCRAYLSMLPRMKTFHRCNSGAVRLPQNDLLYSKQECMRGLAQTWSRILQA